MAFGILSPPVLMCLKTHAPMVKDSSTIRNPTVSSQVIKKSLLVAFDLVIVWLGEESLVGDGLLAELILDQSGLLDHRFQLAEASRQKGLQIYLP